MAADFRGLAVAEALVLRHSAFHLLSRGVGGGANSLDAELEVVGIRGADQRFVIGDEFAGVQIVEGLVEGLHAVLAVPAAMAS